MQAREAVEIERKKLWEMRIRKEGTHPQETHALTSLGKYLRRNNCDLSLSDLLEKLSDPVFIYEVPDFGPRRAEIVINYFRQCDVN